jgi:hypothetical protein
MRTFCLAAMIMAAMSGCGGGAAAPPEAFEIEGNWLFLGPALEPHHLTIGHGTVAYREPDGKWSSTWTLKAYDNALHHFQLTFASGTGTYLPTGQSLSASYAVTNNFLTVQLSNGLASYPPLKNAGTCTDEASGDPTPDCSVYVKQN